MIDWIPVTSLARTLLDYADVAGAHWVRAAIEAAQRQDRFHMEEVRAMIERSPGRRGLKPLTTALEQIGDEAPWTQSEAETRLLVGLRARGVSTPSTNVIVAGELVDLHWSAEKLVVEVDGDRWHKTAAARDRDRRRDVRLQLHGQMVARFTAGRVFRELDHVVSEIAALLAQRRAAVSGPRDSAAGAASGR